VCNDFTPTLLNALRIHNSVTGEKGAANGALEKMAIGRLLVSASTPQGRKILVHLQVKCQSNLELAVLPEMCSGATYSLYDFTL